MAQLKTKHEIGTVSQQNMKYQRLVCNTTPSSLQEWLDEKLDSLGIDGVYTRYILSLLQQDFIDVDLFESHHKNLKGHQQKVSHKCGGPKVLHCGIKNKHQKRKGWGKQDLMISSSLQYNATILDIERLRKKAAVECLKSLTDEGEDIETLVNEVCVRLKNIRNAEVETDENSARDLKALKRKNCYNFPPSSPFDEAEKYFAAFPPLDSRHEQSTEINYRKYLKNIENFWCGKCQKKISKPEDNLDLHFEQDNFDLVSNENKSTFKTLIPYSSLKAMGNVRKSDALERSEVLKDTGESTKKSVTTIILSSFKCKGGKYMKNRMCKKASIIFKCPSFPLKFLVNIEIDVGAGNILNLEPSFSVISLEKNLPAVKSQSYFDESSTYLNHEGKENCIAQFSNKFKNLESIWNDNSQNLLQQSGNTNKNPIWSYEGGNLTLFPDILETSIQWSDTVCNNFDSGIPVSYKVRPNTDLNHSKNAFTFEINYKKPESMVSASNTVTFNVNDKSCAALFNNSRSNMKFEISTESSTGLCRSVYEAPNYENISSEVSVPQYAGLETQDNLVISNKLEHAFYEESKTFMPLISSSFDANGRFFQTSVRCEEQHNSLFSGLGHSDKQTVMIDNPDMLPISNMPRTPIAMNEDVNHIALNNSRGHYDSNNDLDASFTNWMGGYGLSQNIWALDVPDMIVNSENKDNFISYHDSHDVTALRKEIKEEEEELLKGLCCPEDSPDYVAVKNDYESKFCINRSNIVNDLNSYDSSSEYFVCDTETSHCKGETQKYIYNMQPDPSIACQSDCGVFTVNTSDEYYPENIHCYGSADKDPVYYSTNFFNQNDPVQNVGYNDMNTAQEYPNEQFKNWVHEEEDFDGIDRNKYIRSFPFCTTELDENKQGDFAFPLDDCPGASNVNQESYLRQMSCEEIEKQNISQIKHKYPFGRKPCMFFMGGNCRRNDCRFAHDLSSITCRFWLEGSCFKGDTCPFLHGHMRTIKQKDTFHHLRSISPDCKYTLESEADFPSLASGTAKDSTTKSQPLNILPEKGAKSKRRKNKSQSMSYPDDNGEQETSSSWPGVSKLVTKYT